VPLGPISSAGPSAPTTGELIEAIEMETSWSSAPGGIVMVTPAMPKVPPLGAMTPTAGPASASTDASGRGVRDANLFTLKLVRRGGVLMRTLGAARRI
jgi:hypothetical protein